MSGGNMSRGNVQLPLLTRCNVHSNINDVDAPVVDQLAVLPA